MALEQNEEEKQLLEMFSILANSLSNIVFRSVTPGIFEECVMLMGTSDPILFEKRLRQKLLAKKSSEKKFTGSKRKKLPLSTTSKCYSESMTQDSPEMAFEPIAIGTSLSYELNSLLQTMMEPK